MVTIDGDKVIVTLAFEIVEEELFQSWLWFLSNLVDNVIKSYSPTTFIISD